MDSIDPEKRPLCPESTDSDFEPPPAPPSHRERALRRPLPALLLLIVLWLSFRAAFIVRNHYCPHKGLSPQWDAQDLLANSTSDELIPLEAHIVSCVMDGVEPGH